MVKILKQLEIIKNYILLDEKEAAKEVAAKISNSNQDQQINDIINSLNQDDFLSALQLIKKYLSDNMKLTKWEDPEINYLQNEREKLQIHIAGIDSERIELTKLLADFQYMHTKELGEIILEILRLRKLKSKNDEVRYKEAEHDEKKYQKQYKDDRKKELLEISPEEKKDLKKKFRKASALCHPDKFTNESDDIKKRAEDIFKELNDANSKNDLETVTKILNNLEKGILFFESSPKVSNKEILYQSIEVLKIKLDKLKAEIERIKGSESYKKVAEIADWDYYFYCTKELLKQELEKLQEEFKGA